MRRAGGKKKKEVKREGRKEENGGVRREGVGIPPPHKSDLGLKRESAR